MDSTDQKGSAILGTEPVASGFLIGEALWLVCEAFISIGGARAH